MGRASVRLYVAAADANAFVELPRASLKGIAHSDVSVLMGGIGIVRVDYHSFTAWEKQIDTHVVALAAPVAQVGQLQPHPAGDDAPKEALELGNTSFDGLIDGEARREPAVGDLEGDVHTEKGRKRRAWATIRLRLHLRV